jgi:hypothetical protein
MQFRSYPSAFGTSNTFGQTSQSGTSSSQFSSIRGARYTCTTGGQANSISAYLAFAPSTITNLGNTGTSTTTYTSIEGSIVGQRVTTPASQIYVQSISTYIYCSTTAKNMKAAIYDNNGNLVATTNEISVPTGTGSQTFTFSSHPLLQASTNYVLVVWSASGNGEARLYASSTTTGVGRSYSLAYGSWPNPVTFSQNTNNYEIYCTYYQPAKAQCAIYSSNGGSRLGVTDEVSLTSSSGGWVTFPFTTKPTLAASTDYVLMAWSGDSSNVNLYYQSSGSAERFQSSGTVNYNTWPSTVADQSSARQYCIYCTYSQATQHTAGVEFTGTSNTLDWTQLVWKLNGTLTASADVTVQLRNQVTGQYPTSGSGFATSLNTQNTNGTWTITTSPTDFRDSAGSGEWRIKVTAVSASQFDLNLDLVRYTPTTVYYGLDLEEQWTNVNITQPKQNLCIKTGALSSETLMVDAWNNQSGSPRWDSLFNSTNSLLQNQWNNISVTQYMTSPTFTIRFKCGLTGDTYQDSWNISSVLLMVQPDLGFLLSQQDSTTVVEWLENGTMRQFGQNLQLNNQEKPIPPIPVRSIHLNQSFVNGTVKEIPFQVEDWASQYRIPLGMSNNETVFSNRQMIVFQMTTSVTQVTLWWDGRDIANQTSLAFANTRFTDNPTSGSLNNGKLTLQFGGSFNPVTSTLGNVTTTANFMRINGENSTYGAGLAYVIYNGVVRDVVQQEAEWSGGAGTSNDCPDLYANTVLTLPAGTSYYTYQLRLMFINSTSHPRTISDLCPIQLASTISNFAQTENGTLGTSPIVVNGTGLFSNYASTGNWTAHHWSQLINNATGAGSGIMFTDNNNQELYFFDAAGASPARTGALNVNTTTRIIELAPVSSIHTVTGYTTPSGDDITWKGAVVTFDSSTTPVYKVNGDGSQSGLWILVEYQPKIAVNPIV